MPDPAPVDEAERQLRVAVQHRTLESSTAIVMTEPSDEPDTRAERRPRITVALGSLPFRCQPLDTYAETISSSTAVDDAAATRSSRTAVGGAESARFPHENRVRPTSWAPGGVINRASATSESSNRASAGDPRPIRDAAAIAPTTMIAASTRIVARGNNDNSRRRRATTFTTA
jgi:hypothetical protein